MAKCLEFARPVVRRGGSLDAGQAWWQLLKERQHLATLQLAADDHLTKGHPLRGPERPTWRCRDRLSLSFAWLAPLNRGSLNSAHIHGTHVPVEEPSTASGTDLATQTHPFCSRTRS